MAQRLVETLCRTCGPNGVAYSYDAPLANMHIEAQSPGDCFTRTSARSVDGFVFQDQSETAPGLSTYTVSGRGWVRVCRTASSDHPCCEGVLS
ncbi:hypothetical protein K501DRAFT_287219 [Backusella circina FSU 941]|nr:hypothetical protein K501DRAFT_287219 [Backusella circina FSU 941]